MKDATPDSDQQSPAGQPRLPGVSAGLPVLVMGAAFILVNLQGGWAQAGQPWLLFAADVIVLAGVVIGWLSWFQNWAYAFWGMALLFSLWWSSASSGMDRLLAGPLGWSPFLVALALGILLTRSIKPALKFIQGMLRDWSLASLGLYGVLPFAMYASTSVLPAEKAILYQIPAVLLMTAGAATAGRALLPRTRGRNLLFGMSWSWVVVTLGVALDWHGRSWEGAGQAVSWFDQVLGMSLIWVVLALIVFFPAGFARLGRLVR